MDYGKIDIEKIVHFDRYIEMIEKSEWVFNESDLKIFMNSLKETYNSLIDSYESELNKTILNSKEFTIQFIGGESMLNVFNVECYRAALNGNVCNESGRKFKPEEIGRFCGRVKALIEIDNLVKNSDTTTQETDNSLTRIERVILFYYLCRANIIMDNRISQDTKRQSFMIGLLIGQTVDYKQYQDNNSMRKDWPRIHSELASPKPNNRLATVARLKAVLNAIEPIKDENFHEIKNLIKSDLEKLI